MDPVPPTLNQKIKKTNHLKAMEGKFILTAAERFDMYKLIRCDRFSPLGFMFSSFLISVCNQVIRDTIFQPFPTATEIDNFLEGYLQTGIMEQYTPYRLPPTFKWYVPFCICPDDVAACLIHYSILETLKFSKFRGN